MKSRAQILLARFRLSWLHIFAWSFWKGRIHDAQTQRKDMCMMCANRFIGRPWPLAAGQQSNTIRAYAWAQKMFATCRSRSFCRFSITHVATIRQGESRIMCLSAVLFVYKIIIFTACCDFLTVSMWLTLLGSVIIVARQEVTKTILSCGRNFFQQEGDLIQGKMMCFGDNVGKREPLAVPDSQMCMFFHNTQTASMCIYTWRKKEDEEER